ncbi:hypothetical protein JOD03_001376 [Chryseomicrobium aureum]|nr:hypothetical protein [Chryseomicrobium aureum]MBM7706473.1 hypothetical protein [Chryseomicrobium aureum]
MDAGPFHMGVSSPILERREGDSMPSWFIALVIAVVISFVIITEWITRKD